MIVYGDYECPFCAAFDARLPSSRCGSASATSRSARSHPRAHAAACAAEAAARQGAFWPMHDALFADQGRLEDPHLWARAERLGLDVERFDADRRSDEVVARREGQLPRRRARRRRDHADGVPRRRDLPRPDGATNGSKSSPSTTRKSLCLAPVQQRDEERDRAAVEALPLVAARLVGDHRPLVRLAGREPPDDVAGLVDPPRDQRVRLVLRLDPASRSSFRVPRCSPVWRSRST